MDEVSFSQAIQGYLLHVDARHLSPHTIRDYVCTFRKFQDYLGDDPLLASIGVEQVRGFLADQDEVSNKTILNYHTGLSALWTWAVSEDLAQEHDQDGGPAKAGTTGDCAFQPGRRGGDAGGVWVYAQLRATGQAGMSQPAAHGGEGSGDHPDAAGYGDESERAGGPGYGSARSEESQDRRRG